MGRKPLPIGERREVISISLKPATIQAIEALRGDTTRSKWIEEMIGHLRAIAGELKPKGSIHCNNCNKVQFVGEFESGDEYQCHNFRCSLKMTKWFEVKVIE
jgi:hypothetical protein|tara:strand:- start:494 stop:799 length:306 start_codon:yes stop_codon:yes gene_type:complete